MSGLCGATVPDFGYCGKNIMDWSHDPLEHVECASSMLAGIVNTGCNYHRFEEEDIYLPVEMDDPQVVVVELDGKRYTLVNWLDFRGWEVRERDEAFRRFGYLAMSATRDDVRTYRIEPTGQFEQRGFRTCREALRKLVAS